MIEEHEGGLDKKKKRVGETVKYQYLFNLKKYFPPSLAKIPILQITDAHVIYCGMAWLFAFRHSVLHQLNFDAINFLSGFHYYFYYINKK